MRLAPASFRQISGRVGLLALRQIQVLAGVGCALSAARTIVTPQAGQIGGRSPSTSFTV
jgi:hypothetical protein